MHKNPSPEEIRNLLESSRTIAVVGLSENPRRPSHEVSKAMKTFGYEIFPVNPNLSSPVLGKNPHSSLREVTAPVDIVDVFRKSEEAMPIAREAVEIGAKALWLQLGVINEEAAEYASSRGLTVVMNRCIKVDYARFTPGF
ncbi:MAG: CoA-binding protein [Actinomycetota bacterium]|nr:CoA-binding protein [Actinomycetota bacterium]